MSKSSLPVQEFQEGTHLGLRPYFGFQIQPARLMSTKLSSSMTERLLSSFEEVTGTKMLFRPLCIRLVWYSNGRVLMEPANPSAFYQMPSGSSGSTQND